MHHQCKCYGQTDQLAFQVGKTQVATVSNLTGTVQGVTVKVSQNGDWKVICKKLHQ